MSIDFKIYQAHAICDKEFNSRELKISIHEDLPFTEGEVNATTVTSNIDFNNPNKGMTTNDHLDETTTKNFITAIYFDLFSNRVHPPDIRKGESVWAIRMENDDTYYWMSTGRTDNLRRTERMRLAVSDDVAYQKELDDDNTWYFEFDTLHGKKLVISTSKSDTSNPVDYRYRIEIDAEKDTLVICDDGQNIIKLDSSIPRIFLKNRSNTIVDLNDRDCYTSAPDDIVLRAGRQICLQTPLTTWDNTENSGVFRVMAKYVKFECSKLFQVDSPKSEFTGYVLILKDLVVRWIVQAKAFVRGSFGSNTP